MSGVYAPSDGTCFLSFDGSESMGDSKNGSVIYSFAACLPSHFLRGLKPSF